MATIINSHSTLYNEPDPFLLSESMHAHVGLSRSQPTFHAAPNPTSITSYGWMTGRAAMAACYAPGRPAGLAPLGGLAVEPWRTTRSARAAALQPE